MIIAHAPSGYILATSIMRRVVSAPVTAKLIVFAGITGAVAPDVDMLYFHFIDDRQTHHHKYISHWPIVWITLVVATVLWFRYARQSKAAALAMVFCLGGMLHVILDSFVGDIWWFAPLMDQPYSLFTVPARFKPWWLNFILHWSFAVEWVICIWALLVYRTRSNHSHREQ